MSKKRVTIQEAMDHADDIDVYSALQQFPPNKSITRSGLQNVYDFSYAVKNHQNINPFIRRAGINNISSVKITLSRLAKAELK